MNRFIFKASLNGFIEDYLVVAPNKIDAEFIFSSILPSYKINSEKEIDDSDKIDIVEPVGTNVFLLK